MKRSFTTSVVCAATVCLALAALPMTAVAECGNTLDDSFFNRCRKEDPEGPLTALGETITSWVNPTFITLLMAVFAIALPTIHLTDYNLKLRLQETVAIFERQQLIIFNFVHICCYSLALNVALYAVFRQHRPCICDGVQVGSIYGMPSGDAMSGGLVGTMIILWKPFGLKKVSFGLGLLVMLAKCVERLALGFHSLGQVTTGTSLGVILVLYSHNAPQYMVVFDVILQMLIGAIAFPTDSALHEYPDGSHLNIISWYLWGLSFSIAVAALIVRFHSKRGMKGFKQSLFKTLHQMPGKKHDSDMQSATLLGDDELESAYGTHNSDNGLHPHLNEDHNTHKARMDIGDIPFTVSAFLFATVGMYIAQLYMVYAWTSDED